MSKLKTGIMLGLGVMVIALFFNFLRGSGFVEVLQNANWHLVLLGISLNFVVIGLWTLRWDIVLIKMKYKISYIWLYLTTIVANFGDAISPGMRIGGEPFRAYFLEKKYVGVKFDDIAASLVLERVYSTSIFFAISATSIIYVLLKYRFSLKLHGPLLFILIVASTLMFFMFYALFKTKSGIRTLERLTSFIISKVSHRKFWKKIKRKYGSEKCIENYIDKHIHQFFRDISHFIREGVLWTEGTVISIIYWIVILAQAYIFFLAIGSTISASAVVVIIMVSNLSGLITFLPSGMGVTEMIQTALCVLFAVPLGDAAAAVILIRGNYYLFGIVFGYFVMLAMTKGKGHKVVHKHMAKLRRK
jgi:hypothetical protein|tara:strand:+ start:530 stop:1609 length:1080 start_codon:yes stop_codon:yes gene_type:complete